MYGMPHPNAVAHLERRRCHFGSRLDGYRFIAKADIRARAIAITAGQSEACVLGCHGPVPVSIMMV
jgi:hypothetical protein